METVFDDFKDRSFNLNRTYDIELFKAFVNVDMNLNDWSLDFDESLFEFNDVEPHINLKLVNFTCNFTGDFDLHTEPAFYIDKGPAHIYVAPMLVDVGFEKPEAEFSSLIWQRKNSIVSKREIRHLALCQK